MSFRSYISLRKFSLRYRYYCFIDTKEYLADSIFIQNKVAVRFYHELVKPGSVYRFIFCRVPKKEEKGFLLSLEELQNKMLLCGYRDYEEFCCRNIEKACAGQN